VEVILLEKVRNLGSLGEKVKVKPGFARNYLVPQGKAAYATEEKMAEFEKRRAELEKIAAEKHKQAIDRQQIINALPPIVIHMKAGEDGKLFGSIGTRDIAEALTKAGTEIEKRQINLTEGSLRMVGDYDISIELESDVLATVKLKIVAAEG
jgi:large subunit ribosomal protein L9